MAETPDRKRYNEQPTVSFTDWDRVQQIRQILITLEYGQFYNAALLCDAMMRDDKVHGTMATRTNGLLGTPIDFKPGKDTALGRKVADIVRAKWGRFFPASSSSEMHRWGLLLSLGVGENVWTDDDGLWVPRLKPWHPSACTWDWNEHGYWLNTVGERVLLPRTDRDIHGDGKWVVYTPYGFRGFLRGLVRALAMPYILRMWGYRDWARYNEVHGLPIRACVVPAEADKATKDDFFSSVAAPGNEMVLELPQLEAGLGFDMKLIEAMSNSYEGFEKLLEKVESSIGSLILGHANAASGAGGNVYGAKSGEAVRADFVEFDAETWSSTVRDQVLYWFCLYNFGDGDLAPYPVYQTTPPQNDTAAAAALASLAQACTGFATAGAPLDLRKLLGGKFGLPLSDKPLELPKPAPTAPATTPTAKQALSTIALLAPVALARFAAELDPIVALELAQDIEPPDVQRAFLVALAGAWDESKHPRGHGGQFGSGDARRVIEKALANDGATYDVIAKVFPKSGKVVSAYPGLTQIIESKSGKVPHLRVSQLKAYLAKTEDVSKRKTPSPAQPRSVREMLTKTTDPKAYLGVWIDKDKGSPTHGKIWLDVVHVVGNHKEARAVARQHGEKAYYNADKQRTIYMDDVKKKLSAAEELDSSAILLRFDLVEQSVGEVIRLVNVTAKAIEG